MIFFSTLIASAFLVVLTIPILSRLAFRLRLVDLPNERKVHKEPIPRVGGLAMALGALAPVCYWCQGDSFATAYLAGAVVLALFGLLDDIYDLKPRWKLLGQLAAALLVLFWGGVRITSLGFLAPAGFVLPWWLAVPLTVLAIVGVTNAINLSDGLDGLAGGISLLSLCCIGYLAYREEDFSIALIALALAGATYGFLRFNTYPATVFMGDVGSQLLGFSSVTLALHLTQGNTPLNRLLPLIILGFPILDTLTVMTGRIARGRSPFSADKTHFHHSLLELGLHQRESVLAIYLIQVSLLALAFWFRFYSEQVLLAGYVAFSSLILATFSAARRHGWQLKRLAPFVWVEALAAGVRSRGGVIRFLFPALQGGLFLLLLVTAWLCSPVPAYLGVTAFLCLLLLAACFWYQPELARDLERTVLYLLVPFIVYQSARNLAQLPAPLLLAGYRLGYALLALLGMLVSLLTRRKSGFQTTPLDFLILFIAPLAATLSASDGPLLVIVFAKILIIYFSCEVVFAERRNRMRRRGVITILILMLIAFQGLRP